MAMSEIYTFIFKFKNLLITGKNATMTFKAEAGKDTVNLAVEIDDDDPLFGFTRHYARNGPARQRHREKRAAACSRESAERAVHEASAVSEETKIAPEGEGVLEVNVNVVAEEAPGPRTSKVIANAPIGAENKAFKAVIIEPSDDIENVVISNKTKRKDFEAKD